MSNTLDYEALFSGILGQEYNMLQTINPSSTEMSHTVGHALGAYANTADVWNVVEIGTGTGITTLALLMAADTAKVYSIDNEPTMQKQAEQRLQKWVDEGRLSFCAQDALSALQELDSDSVDIVASAYTIHNFLAAYRVDVIKEIYRVLKPGGQFINGDRYALDDVSEHTRVIQQEVSQNFKVLVPLGRFELLEHWMLHLFNDESEHHIMREGVALRQLEWAGFDDIKVSHRHAVNALVTAVKPG